MTVWAQEPKEKVIDNEETEQPKDSEESGKTEESEKSETPPEIASVNHLLIPQRLQLVVDPWEMDGKGQIYSEQYTIKNTGETPGTLMLSGLACQTGEESGVSVKDNPNGLHDDKNKSVYMEIMFGNNEKVILSQEEVSYETEMKPGEELTLSFSGEVNENAANSWKDGDIGVKVVYSWEPKETVVDEENETVSQETQEGDAALEEKEELEEPEVIDLKEEEPEEFIVDSWKIDEQGNIWSPLYKLTNTGEETEIFALSELVCKPAEQSGIVVQTEKEKLRDGDGRFVYMELIPEPEEQKEKPEEEKERYVLLPQLDEEKPEASEYKIELKTGEERTFRLMGELQGIMPEELKKGDIAVTAIISWTVGEAAVE